MSFPWRWFPDRPSLICIINAVVACRVALYIMCTDYRATAVDTRARNWGDMPLQCRLRLPLSVHCYTDLVGCWRGYLPGVRCRLVYGPADAIATHCLLLQYNPDWFTFLVPAYPGSPGQRAVERVCVYIPTCFLHTTKSVIKVRTVAFQYDSLASLYNAT